ncbi:MAG: zinc metallopeptidase [Clostridia bacterium]|nr:zinc metallopeptidase [Clostridia bacterium]
MFWYDPTLIILLPGLLLGLIAQTMMQSTYSKYAKIKSASGLTGYLAARKILDGAGLYHVQIEMIGGELTDHFDPRANVLRLSKAVYESNSVAAIGVAAHECGHAIQYAESYAPMKLRGALVKTTNFSSTFSILIVLVGMLFAIPEIAYIGIGFFLVVVFFQLVTLPVEFNASTRAVAVLKGGILDEEELQGVKKVLTAAAMTYVAAFVNALFQLLRLLAIVSGGERGRRR